MIELFPGGFEEVERGDGVELAAYTDAAGEERMWAFFGNGRAADVDSGWEDRWRAFHRPIRIGRLWVGPPWLEPDADALAVVIDPGRAFGTGAHQTTQLCIETLQELEPQPLLDVGCGSGVLSIAAALLGYAPVVGVDIEEPSIAATLENAAANGVAVDALLVSRDD
ncbi:MAG TPA: 50S ribosomal protein L11 methyltransferase, partial [Gaiellaceae bacterium]